MGNALLKASTLHMLAREPDKALDTASRALTAFLADGQVLGQGLAHEAIGDAQWMQKRRDQAEPSYREAIRLSAAAGDAINEAGARLRLATLLRPVDRPSAMAQADQALALYQRAGLKSGIADTLLEQAWIDGAGTDFAATVDKALKSRALFESLHRAERLARVDYTLSVAWRMRGQFADAASAAGRAVSGYRQLGMVIEEADALKEQAEILRRQDKVGEANAAIVRAQSLVPSDSVNAARQRARALDQKDAR
jgi:tetratricopeptide (TPR) repeat protein